MARLSKADQIDREINPAIERATNALKFVAQHVKNEDSFNSVSATILMFLFKKYSSISKNGGVISYFYFIFSTLMTGNMWLWCLIEFFYGCSRLHVLLVSFF